MSRSASLPRILGFAAVMDLLAGLVLAAVGLAGDEEVLTLVGAVLVVLGAGLLAFVIWQRNRPTML